MKLPPKEATYFTTAVCICEPRGDHGLEGFQLNQEHKAQHVVGPLGNRYWRVWPDARDRYYEICSERAFSKYFKLTKEKAGHEHS